MQWCDGGHVAVPAGPGRSRDPMGPGESNRGAAGCPVEAGGGRSALARRDRRWQRLTWRGVSLFDAALLTPAPHASSANTAIGGPGIAFGASEDDLFLAGSESSGKAHPDERCASATQAPSSHDP